MAVNAKQLPQKRRQDLKQDRLGSTDRYWEYHGWNIWVMGKKTETKKTFVIRKRKSWNFLHT